VRALEWLRRRVAQLRDDPAAIAWMLVVAFVYAGATYVRSQASDWGPDHMMILATGMWSGHSDLSSLTTINDIVTIGDRHYQAMSLLPTVPYLPLVPFQILWPFSRWIVSATIGIVAGWLALPLARRYGPGGTATYWLAALGAFGTLLFTLTIEGDFYYLAHLEAVLLTFLTLIEWKDRRRPWVLGLLIGLAALARPTLLVVAVPIGLALMADVWDRFDERPVKLGVAPDLAVGDGGPVPLLDLARAMLRPALAFGLPLVGAVAITGWWDWVRFGSALETGYGIAWITDPLEQLREQGLFSTTHVPTNVALFIGGGFGVQDNFPWLVPSVQGHSILLTTPAVLIAVGAGIRERLNVMLWGAVIITAIPVFLYYGGGGANTYGYRYEMDFVPFLVALAAIALRQRFGNLEKLLIGLSVAFVCYGYVWEAYR
jgi:hypothetical protein